MYLDTPRDLIGQVHDDLRFGDTPLGRPIIGTKETVNAATRETFMDYLGTLVPARAHGDRPRRRRHRRDGRGRRARAFGDLEAVTTPPPPATELPRRQRPDGAHRAPRLRPGAPDPRASAAIRSGIPTATCCRVLQAVLGGGMSSRLFTEVRERRGLAYYVFASHAGYTDAGSLYVQAGVDTKRIELAVETIWSELRRMATEPVPADEIAKAKRYITGRIVLGVEDARGMILHGLRRALIEGAPVELEEIFAGIEAVTADDVAARRRRPDPAATGPPSR